MNVEETTHQAWAEDGVMMLASLADDRYVEVFETREALEKFIAMLERVAKKVWD